MKLFPKERVVGIFRGFSEGGLEFHADLILPYRNEFQSAPMHGQFLIVQLETEQEAVLGRMTSISSQGRLTSGAGEDYGLRAVAEERPIPEDLLDQYLKYQVNMRVLGVLRMVDGTLRFVASHRRLPHMGSKVAFLSPEILHEVAGHNLPGAELGFFSLGEFIYCGKDKRLAREPWMIPQEPAVIPRFQAKQLVSRRTFVFARAGFGKSNLVKLLFSRLYAETPTVEKRKGRRVPVGTIIFDPDGEYFWPDDKNRPGLCDVPELQDKVVVFTKRRGPSLFYQSFVASDIKLDIRRLRPSDVISIALPPEKQAQQNVAKLRGLNDDAWRALVDEIYANGNTADEDLIKSLLHLKDDQAAETVAARANMTTIVRMLHDPGSTLMDMLLRALREGKLCVVDVSQMRGTPALVLSGLILKRIFDHNQEQFTQAEPETIPTIAVVEEAQSVLGSAGSSGEGPYISWVKEGRKYDLGAVLITQQPGSIPHEILSQGDNWFVFHLLSAGDLMSVKKANAHFSDDLLSTLLNEPIPGHGVFWSSSESTSYPIPIRVLSFEGLHQAQDPSYDRPAVETYGRRLREEHDAALARAPAPVAAHAIEPMPGAGDEAPEAGERVDLLERYSATAIEGLKTDEAIQRIRSTGWPWKGVIEALRKHLPATMDASERGELAPKLVPRALNEILGEGKWNTEMRAKKQGPGQVRWVILKR